MAFAASLSNQSLKSLRSCFALGAGLPFADFLVALARTHSLQLIAKIKVHTFRRKRISEPYAVALMRLVF